MPNVCCHGDALAVISSLRRWLSTAMRLGPVALGLAALGPVAFDALCAVAFGAVAFAPRGLALAGPPEDPNAASIADRTHDKFVCPATLPDDRGAARWLAVKLTPAVFYGARPDLGDLRLQDWAGKDIPYAIRILAPQLGDQTLVAHEFDRVRGKDGAAEISLDLGDQRPEHSALEIELPGVNFRRRVEIDAADKPGDWKRLTAGNLIDFRASGKELRVGQLSYPPSHFRYLRATVSPDPEVDHAPLEIIAARVHCNVQDPGETFDAQATLEPREATPTPSGPGSRWDIRLAAKNLPVDALLLVVQEPEFSRNYSLQAAQEIEGQINFYPFDSGLWTRRRGSPPDPLPIPADQRFPEGLMRLTLTDYANPPLSIIAARTRAAVRELVFENTAELQALAPGAMLRLYFGDPSASAPHYDLEQRLPARLDPPPVVLSLGDTARNPEYSPPSVALSERWPWLIYVVLSLSALALAGVLAKLGRRTIASHDAASAP